MRASKRHALSTEECRGCNVCRCENGWCVETLAAHALCHERQGNTRRPDHIAIVVCLRHDPLDLGASCRSSPRELVAMLRLRDATHPKPLRESMSCSRFGALVSASTAKPAPLMRTFSTVGVSHVVLSSPLGTPLTSMDTWCGTTPKTIFGKRCVFVGTGSVLLTIV
jgi:hypothetical protein